MALKYSKLEFFLSCRRPDLCSSNGLDLGVTARSKSKPHRRCPPSLLPPLPSFYRLLPLSREAIQTRNLLLRGCVLRNTRWVVGLVLNTGPDTKIIMSSLEVCMYSMLHVGLPYRANSTEREGEGTGVPW